jgi:bla regulator protein BlaR1
MTMPFRSLTLTLLLTSALSAQTAVPHQFEIVSIRLSAETHSNQPHPDITPDGIHFTNVTPLIGLLLTYSPSDSGAFGYFTNDVVIGGPEWMRNDRYDIDARIPDADRAAWQNPVTQKPLLQAMLQAMYADRFKLVVHRAQKDTSTFALTIAKGGPKLKAADPNARPPAGINLPGGATFINSRGTFTFYNAPMAALAVVLSNVAGRPVQDATGLSGRYDFSFDRGANVSAADGSDSGPSLFTNLQQQLGLRLESRKASVETLVIDHIERPSEN